MIRATWRAGRRQTAIAMGIAALLSIAALTLSAPQPVTVSAAMPGCSAAPGARLRAVVAAQPARAARVRVGDRLGTRGQYAGRELEVTPAAGATALIELPVESSVAPAGDNVVVYTRVVGGRSEVRAIDLLDGCDMLIAQPSGLVRSAVLDPGGESVYVHAVTASARADGGVVRHTFDGAPPTTALPALPADNRFGRTFGTLLAWSADGATLAVQSCGMEACRTRLLDVSSGRIDLLDDVAHGTLIGVTETHLIAYDACHGQPCAVLAIERGTGQARMLAPEAWDATLAFDPTGSATVSMSTPAGYLEVAP